jgi:hypothetical protein
MFFSTNRGDNSKRAQLIQIYKQGRQLSYNVLMYKQENVIVRFPWHQRETKKHRLLWLLIFSGEIDYIIVWS